MRTSTKSVVSALVVGVVPCLGLLAPRGLAADPADLARPLLDPVPPPLPSVFETKGQRPKSDPSVLPPAQTKLEPSLQHLPAPSTLGLPNKIGEVKIDGLRPLSLEEVENLAEVNNPNLKAIGSQVDQAQSNLRARLAAWYPTLALTANGFPSYTGGQQEQIDANPNTAADGQINTFTNRWAMTGSLTAQWDVINPQRVPEITAARDQFEQSKNQYLIALRELRLQVAQAYFQLQRSDDRVRIGQTSVQASLVSLRDARARFQAGVATKLEVLEAETQLGRDQQLLSDSLANQSTSRRDLARLLDLPQNLTPTAKEPLRPLGVWLPSLQESIIGAYSFREELDNAVLDISVANSQANSALGNVQPFMSLVNTLLGTQYSGVEAILVDLPGTRGYAVENTVGLNFRLNLFDGGASRAQYRQFKQRADQQKFNFAKIRDDIRFEVERTFFDLTSSQRNIQTTSREVLSSRESLRLARLRFQAGVTTQREVVDNQRDLTQAELRYSDSLWQYNNSLAELRRRTGLDQIAICSPTDLSAVRPLEDETYSVPVPPEPLPPACKAAYPSAAS